MPRVLSYTPAWLSRTAPAFRLFPKDEHGNSKGKALQRLPNGNANGDKRATRRHAIAYRGSEVFVASGNSIRWGDLAVMKDDWESRNLSRPYTIKQEVPEGGEDELLQDAAHRVLKLQYVHEPIQHLVISPNSELLAVVTEHTIHICVLPDTSHLDQPDSGPIRPKTQILGPTTHVLSQSAIVSALWHPLGVNGTCLVTITEDAVVRLWELNLDSRWSTEEPTLAVDLKKLQFARSSEDDVQPARIGRNRGFSADDIGMDVASACFGGRGLEEEGAWSAMTLWVAMTEGDIYALCPLLPSRWQPPPTLIPSLTNSIAVKRAFVENTKGLAIEKDTCDRQFNWLAEIDREDPLLLPGKSELSPSIPVYSRPKSPGAVPQLQGPFAILPGDIEDTLDVADIAVIAPTLDTEDLLDNEDDVDMTKGLISSLVCLLTTSGRLFVCLNLDGVEGRWLPPRKPSLRSRQPADDIPVPELVILEAIDTVDSSGNDNSLDAPPTFTPDIHSRYALYVSHNRGIFFFSLATLVQRLANELQEVNNIGLEVRMNAIANGSLALREQILRFREEDGNHELSAPVIMQDSDLGYFLLTVRDGLPQAATLDRPREGSESPEREIRGSIEPQELVPARLTLTEPRPAYQPPGSLYKSFTLRNFMDNHIQSRYKYNLKDEIRLSPATMEIIAEAHRLISRETFEIGKGISDLFARCDRMRIELKNQIDNVREIVEKVDHINEEDADDFGDREPRGSEKLDERLQRTKDKHAELTARYDDLKKKLAQSGGRSLSEREQGWVKEVDKLGRSLVPPGEGEQEAPSPTKQEYWRRFDEAKELAQDLIAQAEETAQNEAEDEIKKSASFRVPPDLRKHKIANVMGLLERESALVDAAQERLHRLSLAG